MTNDSWMVVYVMMRSVPVEKRGDTMLALAVRRFFKHRLGVIGAVTLLAITFMAIFAPYLTSYEPYKQDFRSRLQPPSAEHLLGTDRLGRDVFTRVIYAARVSLSVGVIAVAIQVAIGTAVGVISGYFQGRVDMILQRITDAMMCFPNLLIIITAVALIERPSVFHIMLIIGLLGWPGLARIVRAEVLSIRERSYVEAARALGISTGPLLLRHILPNIIGPIVVSASFGVASAIITETSLSFLGLGVQPPTPSWGEMLNAARSVSVLEGYLWLWVPPGLMIVLSVLSANFIGDALRDALDPKSQRG